MITRTKCLVLLGLTIVLISGCQTTQAETATLTKTETPLPTMTPEPTQTPQPTQTATPSPTQTATPSPTITPVPSQTPQPSPTSTHVLGPEEVLDAYLEAAHQRDFKRMASFLSNYSLQLLGTTREEARIDFEKLDFEGWRSVEHRIVATRDINSEIVLIRAFEKSGYNNQFDTCDWWSSLRKEADGWRVNLGNIVDHVILDIEPQTISDVTVQPTLVVRHTNKLRLYMIVDNSNDRAIHWGWGNELIATAFFGNEAEDKWGALQLQSKRNYPNMYLEFDGWHETYPTSITLSSWYMSMESNPQFSSGESWSYEFALDRSP